MEIVSIGTIRINVPHTGKLNIHDGLNLAERTLPDVLVKRFVDNPSMRIELLMPEGFAYRDKKGVSMLGCNFFIGLLEPLFKQLRDTHFVTLANDARRHQIMIVSDSDLEHKKPGPVSFVERLFDNAWVTCASLEDCIMDRVQIGIAHQDGSRTLLSYDRDRTMDPLSNPDMVDQANALSVQYFKALDLMFMYELEASADILADMSAEDAFLSTAKKSNIHI